METSVQQVSEFDLFTLDDIDSAFQNVTRLTYSQNDHLPESFVRHAVLITDTYNALNNQPPKQQRERYRDFVALMHFNACTYGHTPNLIEILSAYTISKTLEAGGNVLLPVDTAGRVLELLLVLEEHWLLKSLNFPIFFLTYVAPSTIDYVKSFLEWMSDAIAKSFETSRDNAFLLKHATLLISKNELDKAPDGPKVVLASMASLEAGFSHDIFVEWAADINNLVLFTERGQQNRLKKEEALKASLIKEEESKVSHVSDISSSDPMVIDTNNKHPSLDGLGQHESGYCDILIDGFVPPSTSVAPDEDMDQAAMHVSACFFVPSELDNFGMLYLSIFILLIFGFIDTVVCLKNESALFLSETGGDMDGKLDEVSASLILDKTPSKVISNELTVQVKSSLIYMDYEGRSDGWSVKSILAHVAPLKLVLAHGSAEATEHLKQHCLKHVQLSEKLMSNVLFKKVTN
ncbi:hypothetical protein CRYUN_Cryun19dG0080600 [Craigia yunnanensis]